MSRAKNVTALPAASSKPKPKKRRLAVVVLRSLTPTKPGEPRWSLAVGPCARNPRMPCTIHQTVQEEGDATQYRYVSQNRESVGSTMACRYLVGGHVESMFDVINDLIRQVEVQPTPLWLYNTLKHLENHGLVCWGGTEMKSLLERDIESLATGEPDDGVSGLLAILEADNAHASTSSWSGESVSSPSAASALLSESPYTTESYPTSLPVFCDATAAGDAMQLSRTEEASRGIDTQSDSTATRSAYWDPIRQATLDAVVDAKAGPCFQGQDGQDGHIAESDGP